MPDTNQAAPQHSLLLKEAEWLREDIKTVVDRRDRLQIGHLVTLSVICGWIVNRAFTGTTNLPQVDAAVSAARSRPDMALAMCGVAALNMIYLLLSMPLTVRWQMCNVRLAQIAAQMQMPDVWIVPMNSAALTSEGRFAVNVSSIINLALAVALTIGSLWFAYPAARHSVVIATAWLPATVITAIVLGRMALTFGRLGLARFIVKHGLNRPPENP
jgi:hypothetical protein